ncbi:putative carboxylesterase [Lupinus albus]|uniref:Putative carboxylesterase n=1 Tax=Lupinus albus TaxID=3870 RepID=A0A6A4P4T0_LUPAL|nr:putative carboxylesterase [Lupinus albus]KAE9596652.1 putative carboxylesterase [Lupinus albus]
MQKEKRHFVLVHGSCHGAWCWYKVASLLKSAGHQVTALDMAASGIHAKRVQELNSIKQYFEPLIEFLASLPQEERVILVGHSFGGVCISVAMEMFPNKIAAAVFVTAFMPAHNLSFVNLLHEVPTTIFIAFMIFLWLRFYSEDILISLQSIYPCLCLSVYLGEPEPDTIVLFIGSRHDFRTEMMTIEPVGYVCLEQCYKNRSSTENQ